MLLDIIQDKSNLQVSYWGSDGKTHIEVIKIPDEEQYIWVTNQKDKTDLKFKGIHNWNGKAVYKHRVDPQREKLNRYRQYEILDSQPDELKEKIFSYNLPELFFIDIENEMQEGKPNPEKPDKPITVIGVCCPNDTVMVLSGGYNLTEKEQVSFMHLENGLRIRSLTEPTKKMSKSAENEKSKISLSDDPKHAAKKIMSATTDSEGVIRFDMVNQPGISNLITIESLLNNRPIQDVIADWAGQTSYGDLKRKVADSVMHFLADFQERVDNITDAEVEAILEKGEQYANQVANAKLRTVQKAVGLYK